MFGWFRFHWDPAARAVLELAGEFGARVFYFSENYAARFSTNEWTCREKWAQFSHISTQLSTSLSSSLQINTLIVERQQERVRLYHSLCILTNGRIYKQTNTEEQNISDITIFMHKQSTSCKIIVFDIFTLWTEVITLFNHSLSS